jgi:hypothetical protein
MVTANRFVIADLRLKEDVRASLVDPRMVSEQPVRGSPNVTGSQPHRRCGEQVDGDGDGELFRSPHRLSVSNRSAADQWLVSQRR